MVIGHIEKRNYFTVSTYFSNYFTVGTYFSNYFGTNLVLIDPNLVHYGILRPCLSLIRYIITDL